MELLISPIFLFLQTIGSGKNSLKVGWRTTGDVALSVRVKKSAQLVRINSATPIGAASISQRANWLLSIVVLVGLVCISSISSAPAVADAGLEPMCTGQIENDINGDCQINMEDLRLIASDWLASDGNSTDLNNDGIVNFADFARIASVWLDSNLFEGPWILNIIDDSSSGADGVKLADVNYDGLMDITTGWEEGGITRVYLNPGYEDANQPWPAVTVGQTPDVEDAVFVDLDNDGSFDVVSSCEGSTRKLLVNWAPADANDYLNPNSWQTEVIPESDGVIRWYFCAAMQVDGINGIDLVVGTKETNGHISWFEAPANPRSLADFQYHKISDARWIMSLITYDMDGDGDLDVLVTDREDPAVQGCRWLENPGPGPDLYLPWTNHFLANTEREVLFLKVADLDQDGLDDVIVAASPEILYFRRLDPNGLLWQQHGIDVPPNTGKPKGIGVGDIDKDGRLDIVVTCKEADGKYGAIWLSYINDVNDQTWIPHDISGIELGIKYDRLELLDLDGDGDLDVLTCEENEYIGSPGLGVIWYENPYD